MYWYGYAGTMQLGLLFFATLSGGLLCSAASDGTGLEGITLDGRQCYIVRYACELEQGVFSLGILSPPGGKSKTAILTRIGSFRQGWGNTPTYIEISLSPSSESLFVIIGRRQQGGEEYKYRNRTI